MHLHGGFIPWISDGGPFDWWTPGDNDGKGITGASFLNNQVLRPGQKVPAREAEYYYPNQQSARLMWYHDHAYGITRINAYAGIASAYVITDWYEKLLTNFPVNLPGPVDPRTVYLIFQDKIFVDPSTIGTQDPTWNSVTPTVSQTFGSLWYAHVYDTNRWGSSTAGDPSVIPEFFGDTILVNGTVFPTVTLEQREYRIRMLNACNARFLNFRLVKTDRRSWKLTAMTTLLMSIRHRMRLGPRLCPGPDRLGRRFPALSRSSQYRGAGQASPGSGRTVRHDFRLPERTRGVLTILYNNANAPYPSGTTLNDYYPGNPEQSDCPDPGVGPNTRTLLQISRERGQERPIETSTCPPSSRRRTRSSSSRSRACPIPYPLPGANSMDVTVFPFFKVKAQVRHLTLNEDNDEFGRLIQKLGTNVIKLPHSTQPLPPQSC